MWKGVHAKKGLRDVCRKDIGGYPMWLLLFSILLCFWIKVWDFEEPNQLSLYRLVMWKCIRKPQVIIGIKEPWREGFHAGITHCSFYSSARRRKISLWPGNSKPSSLATNGKLPPFCALIFFQWTFVQTTPPHFLLSSIRTLCSFVLWTCLRFAIVHLSWIAIPLLFQNKLCFAHWIAYLSFKKVDSYNLNSFLSFQLERYRS